jgi:hypothetical protein
MALRCVSCFSIRTYGEYRVPVTSQNLSTSKFVARPLKTCREESQYTGAKTVRSVEGQNCRPVYCNLEGAVQQALAADRLRRARSLVF